MASLDSPPDRHENSRPERHPDSTWIGELQFEIHDEAIKFDDPEGQRLIKKVTARHADGTKFWTQVFYRSSGKSSRYNGVWFPFLGISLRRGAPYFTKGLPYPNTWTTDDVFRKFERIPDKDRELIGRFGTRSFLLAANALNALSDDPEQLDDIVSRIFDGVVPEAVDSMIRTVILENAAYDNAKWDKVASSLPNASPEEVNKFVGSDMYINYGKEDDVFDLGTIPIPDFFSMEGGLHRSNSRSRRRRRSLRRLSRKDRRTRRRNRRNSQF